MEDAQSTMASDDSRALFGAPWKLLVVGGAKVGKSSLAHKFATAAPNFDDKKRDQIEYWSTIAATDGQMLNVVLFCQPPHISGPDEILDEDFFEGAHGAMFVFSTTDSKSLTALSDWYTVVRERCGDIPLVLVENKIDLISETKNDQEQVEKLSKSFKLRLYRTSATETYNVVEAFSYLLHKSKVKYPDPSVKPLIVAKDSKVANTQAVPTVRRTNGQKPVFNRYGKCSVM